MPRKAAKKRNQFAGSRVINRYRRSLACWDRGDAGIGSAPVTTEVDDTFGEIERRTERLIGFLRLLALLVLALAFWGVGILEQGRAVMVPLISLGAITVAALVLAGTGLFRPWISWLFATFDVLVLTHCLVMFATATGQPLQLALETPPAAVIFVLLATAAIRHRPFQVLYTGGLFIAVWGAIWLLSAYRENRAFSPDAVTTDIARLVALALVTIALVIVMTRARWAVIGSITEARLRTNLSRYFSPNLVDELARAGNAARTFRSQKAAILFADLRGFTSLAEQMPPDEVAQFLNQYRSCVAEAIGQSHGTIDKFVGDGVMAVFGVPAPKPEDARNAILGGLALVTSIDRWSTERVAEGLPPVEIGVGIHYGDVIVGALGDEQRLEYTVIGDTVNAASRIEQETASLRTPLLVSAEALGAAADLEGDLRWERLPARSVRGRQQPIHLRCMQREAQNPWQGGLPEHRVAIA
jgi:adenylate cyclase